MSHFLPGRLFCQRAYVLQSVRRRYCFTYPPLPGCQACVRACVPPETTPSRAGAARRPPAAALIQALGSCALLSGLAVPDAPGEGYRPNWLCTYCEARKGGSQSLPPSKEETASPAISKFLSMRCDIAGNSKDLSWQQGGEKHSLTPPPPPLKPSSSSLTRNHTATQDR